MYIVLILLLALILVKSARAEEPVRNITNCVYGDSVTPEVCDKLTEDNKPKEVEPKQEVQEPTPQPVIKLEPFEGK